MRTNDDQSLDNVQTYLTEMITAQRARRTVLKGAVAGLASLSALGTGALIKPGGVFAHSLNSKLQHILDVAITAEQLAVTLYSSVDNTTNSGMKSIGLTDLHAALVEEQIHELFLESLGAQPLTSTFSFPNGASTFTDLRTFIETQQQLEGILASIYLAGVLEVAQLDQERLAQILAQIAAIEAEHRVLARQVAGLIPANNYAYEPVLIKHVADAISVLSTYGYLSPVPGNSYAYSQVSTHFPGIEYRTPYVTNSTPGSTGGLSTLSGPGGPGAPGAPAAPGGPGDFGGAGAPGGPGAPGTSGGQTGPIDNLQYGGGDSGPSGFAHKRPVKMGF
ncbi:hypothetical protein KDH_33850 [Dictyobacter sp. S3.2.2.5]|uniref:Ferritin-like domain-containing protein n=1 Tax=Dictyobacter halimunensis TaxID=3026934 RepID=A0ABQ6FUR0_9CHLR|nr:hypothetical protein KDH_33850 [Dictyobacter sp. S3.2.2.5]